MKTIIIHHLQMMWNASLEKYGTSFEEQLEKLIDHLNQNHYDNVIVTNFEAGRDLDPEQYPLIEFCPMVYDYMYGWEKEEVESWGNEITYVDGGSHSEVVIVDDWMKELTGDIFLCGAFDGECIEDMEIALAGAGKEVNRIEELIV